MTGNKFVTLIALAAVAGLTACAEPKPDEECTRADAMKGSLISGCSTRRTMELQNEATMDAVRATGRGAVVAAQVAAPIAAAAATGGAGAAMGGGAANNPLVREAAKAALKQMF